MCCWLVLLGDHLTQCRETLSAEGGSQAAAAGQSTLGLDDEEKYEFEFIRRIIARPMSDWLLERSESEAKVGEVTFYLYLTNLKLTLKEEGE